MATEFDKNYKQCLECKKVFERSYFQYDYRGKIFARCPECNKKFQNERGKKYNAAARERGYIKEYRISKGILPGKKFEYITPCRCKQCDKAFILKGKTTPKMFCSPDCKTEGRRIIHSGKTLPRQEKEYQCKKCKSIFIGKSPGKCAVCKKQDNKVVKKAHEKKRRASLRSVALHPVIDTKVFQRDKWKCCNCGCKVQKVNILTDNAAELDHIVPLSKGGPHSYSNVQTLCRRCNQAKSNNYNGQLVLPI